MNVKGSILRASVGLLIATITLSDAAALAQAPPTVFYETTRWLVEHDLVECQLSSKQDDADPFIAISQVRKARPSLWIHLGPDSDVWQTKAGYSFVTDSHSEPAFKSLMRNSFHATGLTDPLMIAFRKDQQFALMADGRPAATFSLTGSAAAYRELQRCVSQLHDGPLVPEGMEPTKPRQPIPMRQPDLDGPFKPNRDAQPIMLQRWVQSDDYRSNQPFDVGVVRFRLAVSALGRVTACQIVESSGIPRLDERTCKLVQRRARFEPATNANGELIASQWEQSVRWQIPE